MTNQEVIEKNSLFVPQAYDEETCKSNCRIAASCDGRCEDECNMICPHIKDDKID